MKERGIRIRTFGEYLPKRQVQSAEIDQAMGLPAGTCERSSGVAQRYYSDLTTETQSYMAAKAVTTALEAAGLRLTDLDALVNTSGVGEQEVPSNAALTMCALHAEDHPIPAFDINATCMGFTVGFDTMSYPLAFGRYHRIAIVSSEITTVGLDPDDLETRPLFGDGACAAIVERSAPGESSRILASDIALFAAGVTHSELVGGRTRLPPSRYRGNEEKFYFSMKGKLAMRLGAEVVPGFVSRLLDAAGVRLAEIDLIIPHQPSRVGMEIFRKRMGISDEQWMWNLTNYGNMVSATVPFAMHRAIQQGRIVRGDKVLLLGAAAGFGVSAILMEY